MRLLIAAAIAVLSSFLLISSHALADKGMEIALEVIKRDQGWGNTSSKMTMVLKDKYGQSTQRSLRNSSLEGSSEGDKSLVIFDTPGDVRGTAFLSHTKKTDTDDQWLYLPALKRVKRIASSNKAGPFMGSEFSFEDIASQEIEKYTYKYLRDEKYSGVDCFVVQYDPVDRKSGYSFQDTWIDKSNYIVLKTEYYDRKKSLLKTLTFDGYKKYKDKFWRADTFLMVNHQTGKETELQYENWVFDTGLSDKDFNKNMLKRVK
ncbi:MAG: outer membrane lipoprotein-sorting protein [Aestuariivita sp.]|nr:outer membrane lipoprotein-sorting protein [Aestuariivita sp.]